MSKRFVPGDRVRVDIPDERDPEHDEYHGKHGVVREVRTDDAGETTGDERDGYLFTVELDSGPVTDFRWRDLRPA